jgi:hypothetical protein
MAIVQVYHCALRSKHERKKRKLEVEFIHGQLPMLSYLLTSMNLHILCPVVEKNILRNSKNDKCDPDPLRLAYTRDKSLQISPRLDPGTRKKNMIVCRGR